MIYDLGQSTETLYVIKSGRVALDVFYEIERTISIPIGHKRWEKEHQKTFQIVRRTVKILSPNSIFGLEEILSENPRRLIRARALEDTECLYANKKMFIEYLNADDREKIKLDVSKYTNFESEAKLLLMDIQNKKTKVFIASFLSL